MSCIAGALAAGAWLVCATPADPAALEVTRDVTYVEHSGEALRADIYVPNGPGPFPAVVAIHGGGWMMGDKSRMAAYCQRLAAAGFTAATINYRLAPQHPFPAQIEDCKAAIRWMRRSAQRYKIDVERLGAVGYSAGGHLAALLGTTDAASGLEGAQADGTNTRVQCVVAGGAPCDFRDMPPDSRHLAYWLGGTRADRPQAYQLASPARFVTADDPPMLFFHGDADSLVPIDGARAMVETLTASGVPARLYAVEGVGHLQAFFNDGAQRQTVEFFTEQLAVQPQTGSSQRP